MPTAFICLCRDGLGQPVHFALDQPPVNTLAPQQGIGRSVLHDLSELEHDNAVEIAHA